MMSHRQRPRRSARHQRGAFLLLWGLTWSVLLLVMVVGYHPMLQTMYRATAWSSGAMAARNLADAAANEALWYAQYGLLSLATNSFGCAAPWTADCINKGAPLVDLNTDGTISMLGPGDIFLATDFPFHASHGWNPQVSGTSSTATTKTGSLSAGDGSGQVIGQYSVTVSRLHLLQPWITAQGFVPNSAAPIHTKRTRVVLERIKPQALYAAFGRDRLILGNHVRMDSYDSGQGGYGGTNISQKARIGSNAKGSSPQVDIQNTDVLVQGKLLVSPGAYVLTPGGAPITNYVLEQKQQQDQALPSVQIPSSLTGIIGYTAPPAGVTTAGAGEYTIPPGVTWTCTGPTKVKSLDVQGEFRMGASCELLVDNGYALTPTYALDTNGSGKITKTETTTTARIFARDASFNLDGYGASFDSSIAEADRDPQKFQLFTTCTIPPCTYTQASLLAQAKEGAVGRTFYGVVYVEDGSLDVQRGRLGGTDYDATYQGAFVAGKMLNVGTVATSKTVYIHYDEQVGRGDTGVELDGSNTAYQVGDPIYRVLSWQTN